MSHLLYSILILILVKSEIYLAIRGNNNGNCPQLAKKNRFFVSTLGDMCYMYVGIEMYWDDARNYCWNLGGDLISIENQDIMDHIKKIIGSRRVRWSSRGIWIGAKYDDDKREWRWTNGKQIKYSNWARGQPSLTFGISFEDCGIMRREDDWKWHDYYCHYLRYHYRFICQFKALGYTSQVEDTPFLQSVDNGNAVLLGVIIGTALFIILIIILVFLTIRYIIKKKFSLEPPVTLYGNDSFEVINGVDSVVYHNRDQPHHNLSNQQHNREDEESLYMEIDKPANPRNAINGHHAHTPLLGRHSDNNSDNIRITQPDANINNNEHIESPSVNIPALMQASTSSANEYVEMSGASNNMVQISQGGVNVDSKALKNTEPIYSNTPNA